MTAPVQIAEFISGVALLREDGAMWCLPAPSRHYHLFALAAFMGVEAEPCEQGFVTSRGRFVDRAKAVGIARAASQTTRKHGSPKELYSEDLW